MVVVPENQKDGNLPGRSWFLALVLPNWRAGKISDCFSEYLPIYLLNQASSGRWCRTLCTQDCLDHTHSDMCYLTSIRRSVTILTFYRYITLHSPSQFWNNNNHGYTDKTNYITLTLWHLIRYSITLNSIGWKNVYAGFSRLTIG